MFFCFSKLKSLEVHKLLRALFARAIQYTREWAYFFKRESISFSKKYPSTMKARFSQIAIIIGYLMLQLVF